MAGDAALDAMIREGDLVKTLRKQGSESHIWEQPVQKP